MPALQFSRQVSMCVCVCVCGVPPLAGWLLKGARFSFFWVRVPIPLNSANKSRVSFFPMEMRWAFASEFCLEVNMKPHQFFAARLTPSLHLWTFAGSRAIEGRGTASIRTGWKEPCLEEAFAYILESLTGVGTRGWLRAVP